MTMAFEEFAREFGAIVEEEPGEISPERELLSIPMWDSTSIVNLMIFASEKFDRVLDPETIAAAKTVKDLYVMLDS